MKRLKNWKASKRESKTSPSNQERANCAEHALTAYARMKEHRERYDGVSDMLTDLVSDLYHYAASQGIDLHNNIKSAQFHFEAER